MQLTAFNHSKEQKLKSTGCVCYPRDFLYNHPQHKDGVLKRFFDRGWLTRSLENSKYDESMEIEVTTELTQKTLLRTIFLAHILNSFCALISIYAIIRYPRTEIRDVALFHYTVFHVLREEIRL